MAKKVRVKSTEKENIANIALGDSEHKDFNMRENDIDSLIEEEKSRKFNSQVEEYNEMLEKHNEDYNDARNNVKYDINKAEIKPMFSRVLIKPFAQNPFQKLEIKKGLIVDTGGYTPHLEKNPVSGKYEEQKEFIVTGCIIECGPEVQYLKDGDVVYYRADTAVPVPFFKQGFVSLAENQIIAVVNEGLEKRFNERKNNGR